MQLLINGEKREYPSGTTWLTVAKDYQKDYQDEILALTVMLFHNIQIAH